MLIPINKAFGNESIERLEDKICEYTGAKYALATTSATAGLLIILMRIKNVMLGDEILVPAYGFPAVYKICRLLALNPIPVDIDYDTMGMNLHEAEEKVSNRTVAIVNVETTGVMGNPVEMKSFAEKHGLTFIEDSASALVQNYNGTNAGRFGDVGVYSFADSKVLNSGQGGAIVTDSKAFYDDLKDLRYSSDYSSQYPLSMNFQMSSWLADLLIPQFDNIEILSKDRERVHNSYKEYGLNIFEAPAVSNRYQYIIYRTSSAWKAIKKLTRFKIGHRHKHYSVFDSAQIASKIKSEVIELPSFFRIEDGEIQTICNLIKVAENDRF